MKRISFFALVLTAAFAVAAAPQAPSGDSSQKKIEKVAIKGTAANSGADMYKSYCAPCHGTAGKGDGPAASALKQPPSDLTMLAKKSNGKFPAERVSHALKFGTEAAAHGTKEMPIWGPLLGSLQGGPNPSDAMIQLRIANLTKYVESLQAK
jgi:mono/diheme cytochrome c family protein